MNAKRLLLDGPMGRFLYIGDRVFLKIFLEGKMKQPGPSPQIFLKIRPLVVKSIVQKKKKKKRKLVRIRKFDDR